MDQTESVILIGPFRAVTYGIIVLFIGRWLVRKWRFLRLYNIPEPVAGGLPFAMVLSLIYFGLGWTIQFNLAARDVLLVYFFTTIGLNAKLGDLLKGGRPMAILLAITVLYMAMQNFIGIGIASSFGLPPQMGLLSGTVALVGGHGTAIAWAPEFVERYGVPKAMEIGIASATLGLVLASSIGGPIASYLIRRHSLKGAGPAAPDVGVGVGQEEAAVDYYGFLQTFLALHLSITLGAIFDRLLQNGGFKLPLFVSCLFAGIILANTVPRLLPTLKWPTRNASLALVGEVTLGTFLAMSLMSIQLWKIIELAVPLLTILIAQVLCVILLTVWVVFRVLGHDYEAAVMSAGFAGFAMGSTATAMANMTAVTQRHGPCHLAFVVVPLVCAFFIDLVNALMIQITLAIL